jgi:N-acetylmuramoyl-L-alanine amidase
MVSTLIAVVLALALALSGCGASPSAGRVPARSRSTSSVPRTTIMATTPATTGTTVPSAAAPLQGKVVTIDPGHNGDNYTDPAFIDAPVWNGRENESCDTTGTETDGGYTEAQFNFDVAQDAAADLRAQGATVVLTRTSNSGVGPCVTERAAIGNEAHSDAAISIHADGGPAGGRGFAVLEPVADGVNDAVITPSAVLGSDVRAAFVAQTGMPVSTYDGVNGIAARDDLAGLNLSTVPKVLIECGNMRNATDAALLVSPTWQAQAARAITSGITTYLRSPTG